VKPRGRPKARARRARSRLYRELVLEAAERDFAERGYDDAKMEEIAREAGLALGTVYSVLPGKLAIFRAVHELRIREMVARCHAAARELASPLERLLAGVRAYVEFFLAYPDYLRLHLRQGHAWGLGAAALPREPARAWREGVALQAANFAAAIREGRVHPGDPELAARMMIAVQQVQLAAWVEGGLRRDPAEVVREVETQVRRAFCR
jgi:AcrR family transcriptional regulator